MVGRRLRRHARRGPYWLVSPRVSENDTRPAVRPLRSGTDPESIFYSDFYPRNFRVVSGFVTMRCRTMKFDVLLIYTCVDPGGHDPRTRYSPSLSTSLWSQWLSSRVRRRYYDIVEVRLTTPVLTSCSRLVPDPHPPSRPRIISTVPRGPSKRRRLMDFEGVTVCDVTFRG